MRDEYKCFKLQKGFSLIEVIVALAIVAISLGAVIHAVGVAANHETIIGEKTFARWVAMNQIAKAQLEHAWPAIGKTSGDEEMAGATWFWEQKTLSTQDQDVRRVELSVWNQTHQQEEPAAFLVGFVTR